MTNAGASANVDVLLVALRGPLPSAVENAKDRDRVFIFGIVKHLLRRFPVRAEGKHSLPMIGIHP